MAYEKMKSETYANLSGINTKLSTYLTGPHEALDLQNIDFSRVGSWSQRQGSTLYFGNPFIAGTVRTLGIFEYEKLSGSSQIVVWNNGSTILVSNGTTFIPIKNEGLNFVHGIADFTVFNDFLIVTDGNGQYKYDGSSLYNWGLPLPPFGGSLSLGSYTFGVTSTAGTSGTGYSGTISVAMGFMDNMGFKTAPSNAVTLTLNGTSFSQFSIFFSSSLSPWNSGLTAISLYVQPPGSGTFYDIYDYGAGRASFATAATIIISSTGSSATSNPANQSIFNYPVARYPLFPFDPSGVPGGVGTQYFGARFCENYNSQVYYAGFSTISTFSISQGGAQNSNYQSRLYWTNTGEPEFIDPTYFAEIRTNDGDQISGIKNYNNTLLIFKQRSFHRLFATSPTDVSIQEVSDQYGCISNRAIVVFNQVCLFLDRKGIAKYDGANVGIISNKVEPIFKRMNLTAAQDNAVAVHLKLNNQVWFSVPVDGATMNNLTVVYDYFSDAWTTFNGFVPSAMTIAKGNLSEYNLIYGSYSGAIYNFGSSLPSDNGVAISLSISSLFYRDMGVSVEKQFRRLFMNTDIMSTTATINVKLVPDYGATAALSTTMAVGGFQNRIDFGVPAKAAQFQFAYANASLPIRINGITVESRYQRAV